MLKKILSQSTLAISMKSTTILTPSKKTEIILHFENITEYDMPLSVNLSLPLGVNANSALFDITVPAFGNTQKKITFCVKDDELMFCGEGVCEISAFDRVLETTDNFELNLFCEMSYKCDGENLFSRNGVFYINSGEEIKLQLAQTMEKEVSLCVLSGELSCVMQNSKLVENPEKIVLGTGVNNLIVTSAVDSSFCFTHINSDNIAFINTINAKNFVEE